MFLKYVSIITVFLKVLFLQVNARVEIIAGAHFENCTEPSQYLKANAIDVSQLHLHTENDTHTFLDGTVKFLKGFDILPGRFYTEMFDRGQWFIQAFDRSYPDLCTAFHDPLQPFYNYCKHFPMCPHKTGFNWDFNMNHLDSSEKLLDSIPKTYMGKWRMVVIFDFTIDNVPKRDCLKFPFEIFDI